MQNHKTLLNRISKNIRLRISKDQAAILVGVVLLNWLATTAYVVGQFEIKTSVLILNKEGCTHLIQVGITPLPQTSDTCRIQTPFRANLLDTGGRVLLDSREIRIPEHQLVAAIQLEDQPWTAHHWLLVGWEAVCLLLMQIAIWIALLCKRKGDYRHGH